ncbi:MAG: SAM-dependent methyltransferase [Oscillospiraceae bacterium]|nr:SAM-dependent methyltransferase [Oscillospiraceae bacterium]
MSYLDNRLGAAFEFCRSGVVSVDVGCDHARLAAALAIEKNCRVIASDVKDGPLEAAKRTLSELGVTSVLTVKSDGLDEIDFADDVIICGMGGELIADIAERCRFKSENTRFILQPMTKADVMRKRLYKAGFELLGEKTAEDGGKVYSVMLWKFTGISREIGEIEAICGKNRDRRYLEKVAEKLVKNAKNMEKSSGLAEEAERLRKTADAVLRIAGEDENS